MLKALFAQLYTDYRNLVGAGAVITLFASCALVVIVSKEMRDRKSTPVLLSVFCTIGCAAAVFFDAVTGKCKDKRCRIIAALTAAAFILLAIASSGRMIASPEYSKPAENHMHLPEGLREAMDAALTDGGDSYVLTMPEWEPYVKAYSSRFSVPSEGVSEAHRELSDSHPDMRRVAQCARRTGCKYVVLSAGLWPDVPITRFGYELLYENENCLVYREVGTL